MCKAIYLASHAPLPSVGSMDEPVAFVAAPATHSELKKVRKHLTKTHRMYLGSHQGCGCGFHFKPSDYDPPNFCVENAASMPDIALDTLREWDRAEQEELAVTLQSLRELSVYLSTAALASDLEMIVTWNGELTGKMERRRVTVDFFTSYEQGIDLPENCLFEITRVGADDGRLA
jgi:hypothetical protein